MGYIKSHIGFRSAVVHGKQKLEQVLRVRRAAETHSQQQK